MWIEIDSTEETLALTEQTHTHTWASIINCENNKSKSVDVIKPSVYQFVMAEDTCTQFYPQGVSLTLSLTHTHIHTHTHTEVVYYDVH